MGVALDHKAQLEAQLRRGCGQPDHGLPDLPDGPRLEYFSALELAQAIEAEVNRAAAQGLPKLRLDMDHADALKLASYLRRAVLRGV